MWSYGGGGTPEDQRAISAALFVQLASRKGGVDPPGGPGFNPFADLERCESAILFGRTMEN
jgi:hypothetical protein